MALTEQPPRTSVEPKPARIPPGMQTEETTGGLLVYEPTADRHGRRLAGFADVTDWDVLRDELAKHGHGVGALYHLPTLRE
ncbi:MULTISPECIES: hypothetical protein [Halorussus]|uniref:hypothetical protein n=1 Tax=Halorussus TaxID=1070314 RepID=UPI0020A10654|nr:hypothetical protein [Halorussus vallis]USZ78740.1 hypothetical protein NGM07_24830 [Halorussus vallis]